MVLEMSPPLIDCNDEVLKILRKNGIPHVTSRFDTPTKKVYILGKIGAIKGLSDYPILTPMYSVKESLQKQRLAIDDFGIAIERLQDLTIALSDDVFFIAKVKDIIRTYEESRIKLKELLIYLKNKPTSTVSIDKKRSCLLCGRNSSGDYCYKCKPLIEALPAELQKLMYRHNRGIFDILWKISIGKMWSELFIDATSHSDFEKMQRNNLVSVDMYAFPKKISLTFKGRQVLDVARVAFEFH